jgi:hypothetical protein
MFIVHYYCFGFIPLLFLFAHLSYADPVPQNSLVGRLDPFEEEIIYDDGLETELFPDLDETSADPNGFLLSSDIDPSLATDYCTTSISPSRKRNGVCLDESINVDKPEIILPNVDNSYGIEETSDEDLDSPFLDFHKCSFFLFGIKRTLDLCCDGPLSDKFRIDQDVRIIYNWIGNCRDSGFFVCPNTQYSTCCRFQNPIDRSGLDCVIVENSPPRSLPPP